MNQDAHVGFPENQVNLHQAGKRTAEGLLGSHLAPIPSFSGRSRFSRRASEGLKADVDQASGSPISGRSLFR